MNKALYGLALATLVLGSGPVSAKTQTIRIEISGGPLATPLEITKAKILAHFTIWDGPRVGLNGQLIPWDPKDQERGAFINWSLGVVSILPSPVQRYDVVFHQGGREPMHEWHRRYVVRYAYDPATIGGYIYLPGPNDGDDYKRNVFSILRGVEGNWFHSSAAWERLVRPLIDKAVAAAHGGCNQRIVVCGTANF